MAPSKHSRQLHREKQYRIVFFVNMAPIVCPGADRFFDGGRLADDAALLEVLGRDTPAVSSTRAFLQYRPSQMPAAGDHAIGNSNAVKADVLFRYLRDRVLPPVVPGAAWRNDAASSSNRSHRLRPRDRAGAAVPPGSRTASAWLRIRARIAGIARRFRCSAASPSAWRRSPRRFITGIAAAVAVFLASAVVIFVAGLVDDVLVAEAVDKVDRRSWPWPRRWWRSTSVCIGLSRG